jgi:hypothetical protein
MPIGIYDTAELVKVIRTVKAPSSYWLDLAFPTVVTFDTKEIDFDYVDKNRRLAPFVSPLAQGVPLKQQGYLTRRFTPAYIKPKDVVDPARLLKRQAGEALMGSLSPAQREDLIVADILETHRFAIERRWEWMAARAVIDGAVTVSGPDYPTSSVSFSRDASMSKNLTGTARWSEATSTPLADIETWMQEMHRLSGYTPTRITMGINAWDAFKSHADVKEMLDTRRGSKNQMESGPGNGMPWQYRGSLDSAGGLEVWTYNDIYEDDAGNSVNFLDQDTVVLTSPAVEGVRAFGAIMDRRIGWAATPMFSKMWEQEDPSALYLMTQSAPLMIPTRPNASLKAKVLNAA